MWGTIQLTICFPFVFWGFGVSFFCFLRLTRGHFCSRSSVKPNWDHSRAGFDQLSSLRGCGGGCGCGHQIPDTRALPTRWAAPKGRNRNWNGNWGELSGLCGLCWPLPASLPADCRAVRHGPIQSEPEEDRRFGRLSLSRSLRSVSSFAGHLWISIRMCVCVGSYLDSACVREPANRLSSRHPSCSCGPGRSWPGRHCDSNFPLAQSAPLTQRDGEREREKESAERAYLVPQRRSIPASISL